MAEIERITTGVLVYRARLFGEGIRQFMIGLASVLREHGRSSLLTQTIAEGHVGPVDGAVSLNRRRRHPRPRSFVGRFEINRLMRVIKMRADRRTTSTRIACTSAREACTWNCLDTAAARARVVARA